MGTVAAELRSVAPGRAAILDVGRCIDVQQKRAGAVEVVQSDGGFDFAIYRALEGTTSEEVTLTVGNSPRQPGAPCAQDKLTQFILSADRTPEIPADALDKAFRILMMALVLAIVLEQAFALLFNWRVFQEFAVGRAWRTPILFAGALLVVRNFNLDLVASLLEAYRPAEFALQPLGNGFTSILTAMVLGGGSAGVNRVLVGLKFRSEPEQRPGPALDATQAWVSLEVEGWTGGPLEVVLQRDPATVSDATTAVSVLHEAAVLRRLKGLLFPNRTRFPSSGGYTVEVGAVYRLGVKDEAGQLYDLKGKRVDSTDKLEPRRFGPRAVVDYRLKLEPAPNVP